MRIKIIKDPSGLPDHRRIEVVHNKRRLISPTFRKADGAQHDMDLEKAVNWLVSEIRKMDLSVEPALRASHTCKPEWVNCTDCHGRGSDQYGNSCHGCDGKGKIAECAQCEVEIERSINALCAKFPRRDFVHPSEIGKPRPPIEVHNQQTCASCFQIYDATIFHSGLCGNCDL